MTVAKLKELDAQVTRLERIVKSLAAINRCWYYDDLQHSLQALREACKPKPKPASL